MSRIFITGATGFLGASVLRQLLEMDDSVEVAVLIRPETQTWRIDEQLQSERVIGVEGRFEELGFLSQTNAPVFSERCGAPGLEWSRRQRSQ